MDYSALVKQLTLEMKKGVQYKRMDKPFRILTVIAMIPLIVAFVLSKLGFWFTLFFYKMLSSPADALHKWLRDQKDDVQHATQAVIYLVCLPAIFGLQLLLAACSFTFFVQWFVLMIEGYLLSLGGIKWQPFVTEASFGEDAAVDYKPGKIGAMVFSGVAIGSVALGILFSAVTALVALIAPEAVTAYGVIGAIAGIFYGIYWLTIVIVNPIMFKRIEK